MNRMLRVDKHLLPDEPESNLKGALHSGPANFYIRVLRHQLPIMIVFLVLSLALAVFYLVTTTPTFDATASMVIDARNAQTFDPDPRNGAINVDISYVQTQIELLKSDNVSRTVINKLKLGEDPEFAGGPPGLVGSVINYVTNLFKSKPPAPDPELERLTQAKIVLAAFAGKRMVTRVGQSYVMDIDVLSANPEKAARIANAIADAYIDDLLDAKFEETKRASVWLQERLKELRAQASIQRRAVVDFRKEHNIVDTGANGQLMNDQQVSEVNTQLILAQAATAEAKARYERIQEVLKQEVPDASVTDALNNPIIVKLRGEYLDLAAHEAIWTKKYGPDHLSVVAVKNQMRELQNSIKDQMIKIEQSYKSDYEIALAREESLRTSLGTAVSQTQLTNQAQVQERELQSAADTSKALYDNFLQRYMQAVQSQSFPITEARLVSMAEAPLAKSYPKTSLIMLLALVGGSMLSFGVGALRETMDRVFRSSDRVEEELQISCLAMLPRIKPAAAASVKTRDLPDPAQPTSEPNLLKCSQSILDFVLDQPFDTFSESLRTVKVTSDLSGILKVKKVVGMISSLPGEGKSTVSANFAQLIAHSGSRALLIDADLRNPTLSRQLADEGPGLIDVLAGWKSLDEILLLDPRSGLRFLPAGAKSNLPHTNELLASDAMKKLITRLKESYDYLIVDLPPLIPVVDARASTNFVDAYLFTVEWGVTKIDLVRHALSNAPEVFERLLGVILNKVDMARIGRYERYRNDYYYDKYRSRYGNFAQTVQGSTKNAEGHDRIF